MTYPDDDEVTGYHEVPHILVPRNARRSALLLVRGAGAPLRIPLSADEVVVGRSPRADICFPDAGLSRQHAALARTGPDFRIEDLGSRNGVFLNGLRVHAATLRHGDTLQLGELVFQYEEGDP